MGIKIKPNEPLKCIYLGLPAEYMPIYEGGYEVRISFSNIPLEGHEFSHLHEHKIFGGEGEISFIIDRLDIEEVSNIEQLRMCKCFN